MIATNKLFQISDNDDEILFLVWAQNHKDAEKTLLNNDDRFEPDDFDDLYTESSDITIYGERDPDLTVFDIKREPIDEDQFIADWAEDMGNKISYEDLQLVINNLCHDDGLEQLINLVLNKRDKANLDRTCIN